MQPCFFSPTLYHKSLKHSDPSKVLSLNSRLDLGIEYKKNIKKKSLDTSLYKGIGGARARKEGGKLAGVLSHVSQVC